MKMYQGRVKLYDKKLSVKKHLDWLVEILRPSVYNKRNVFSIVEFKNQHIGSWNHMVERLKAMDSTRHDFFTPSILHNNNLRKPKKSDDRLHRDIASFIRNWTQFVW